MISSLIWSLMNTVHQKLFPSSFTSKDPKITWRSSRNKKALTQKFSFLNSNSCHFQNVYNLIYLTCKLLFSCLALDQGSSIILAHVPQYICRWAPKCHRGTNFLFAFFFFFVSKHISSVTKNNVKCHMWYLFRYLRKPALDLWTDCLLFVMHQCPVLHFKGLCCGQFDHGSRHFNMGQ